MERFSTQQLEGQLSNYRLAMDALIDVLKHDHTEASENEFKETRTKIRDKVGELRREIERRYTSSL